MMKSLTPSALYSQRTTQSTRINSRSQTKQNKLILSDEINNNMKTEKSQHLNVSRYSQRSNSNNKIKLNQLNKILSDPNNSNLKALESIILEVKNNAFDKVKSELEEKIKEKALLEKNVEYLKTLIKFNSQEEKQSIRIQAININEHMQIKALETRVQNELSSGFGLNEIKSEISKAKLDYEMIMEENRNIRNDILIDDKLLNVVKEDIKKTNKLITDTNKEKDNIKGGIIQLKRHIKLMKDKVNGIDDKNKSLLMKFYSLSLN